jgi:tRNA(Leu) C34 or U34 (ribose-2'-O)-methylase TrmL
VAVQHLLIEVDPAAGLNVEVAAAVVRATRGAGGVEGRAALLVVGPPVERQVLAELGVVQVPLDAMGLGGEPGGPRAALAVGAAAVGALVRDVAVVSTEGSRWEAAARSVGATSLAVPAALLGGAADGVVAHILAALGELRRADEEQRGAVGVGPHPEPWPDDPRLDPALLAAGDRRNVVDRYRYWREDSIVADLDRSRHDVHVAVENWQHDLNIGTVVRNANAFNVAGVHIVGERRWNRRGAMATDRYLAVAHHASVEAFAEWAAAARREVVGIDNVPGSVDLDAAPLPAAAVLVLGQEGPGLSAEMVAACGSVRSIGQHGSTRSLNAGVASGIALHAWVRAHGRTPPTWPEPPPVP